jgi:hypothetical protein
MNAMRGEDGAETARLELLVSRRRALALPKQGMSIYVEGRKKGSNIGNQPVQDPKTVAA